MKRAFYHLIWFIKVKVLRHRKCTAAIIILLFLNVFQNIWYKASLPPEQHLYRYFEKGGIKEGLVARHNNFYLNGRKIQITSGSMHYFRVHPAYWRQRVRQMKAAGLNTIDTYIPWNLHEPVRGYFDFGGKDNDMSIFLDIKAFIEIVEEEGMFLILRPGPYICAEWEFGGLPSWLLRESDLIVRSSQPDYLYPAISYLQTVLFLLRPYLWSKVNGAKPIIMIQIENEYGSFEQRDKEYMLALKRTIMDCSFDETFLFTSDNHLDNEEVVPSDTFQAINFKEDTEKHLRDLETAFPDFPVFVMEFWPGWFDWWGREHHTISDERLKANVEPIFNKGASINFYMFHGGTNFGFMSGAFYAHHRQKHIADVTSYDYDAPITEYGGYTTKYSMIADLIKKYRDSHFIQHTYPPPEMELYEYPKIKFTEIMHFKTILQNTERLENISLTECNQEALDINEGSGQSYGFTAYIPTNAYFANSDSITIKVDRKFKDLVYTIINDKMANPPFENPAENAFQPQHVHLNHQLKPSDELILLVENAGRVNYGFKQYYLDYKGIDADSLIINDVQINYLTVHPLEFKTKWLKSLQGWQRLDTNGPIKGPVLLRAYFTVDVLKDTFVDLSKAESGEPTLTKGNVFINGFNLGRYWNLGPQRTLYLPAPLLNTGENEIIVFELFCSTSTVFFSSKPILDQDVSFSTAL